VVSIARQGLQNALPGRRRPVADEGDPDGNGTRGKPSDNHSPMHAQIIHYGTAAARFLDRRSATPIGGYRTFAQGRR